MSPLTSGSAPAVTEGSGTVPTARRVLTTDVHEHVHEHGSVTCYVNVHVNVREAGLLT